MENYPKNKERARSSVSYFELKKIGLEKNLETHLSGLADFPPFMSLSSSVMEYSAKIEELSVEREQDQYLISVLKKHCFEQSKDIEKLKQKLESLQADYESLLEKNTKSPKSLIETAIYAKTRSEF